MIQILLLMKTLLRGSANANELPCFGTLKKIRLENEIVIFMPSLGRICCGRVLFSETNWICMASFKVASHDWSQLVNIFLNIVCCILWGNIERGLYRARSQRQQ